jgi:type II secretion system protein G
MFLKLLNKKRGQNGFTLLELIFVVVILGILAGIALINLGGTDDDAKEAAIKTDLQSIATALKVYKAKTGAFPTVEEGLEALAADKIKTIGTGDDAVTTTLYRAMLNETPKQPGGIAYSYSLSVDEKTATIASTELTTNISKNVK